jgi:hypothetical protein
MSADKSIKFQFALDENSFNRVKTAMDTLIRQAQTLANTLKSIQLPGAGQGGSAPSGGTGMLGGGGVGAKPQTQLGKVVMDNAGAFQNMAAMGGTAIKGLTAALKQGVREQEQEIQRLNRAMNALGNAYNKLQAGGRSTSGVLAKMVSVGGKMTAAQNNLFQMQGFQQQANMAAGNPMAALLQGVPTMAGAVNIPGGAASPVNGAAQVAAKSGLGLLTPIGPGNLNAQGLMGMLMGNGAGAVAMRSAGLIASGATGIANTSFAINNMEMDTRADRGNAIRARYERTRRVDITDALAENFLGKQLSRGDATSYFASALGGDADAMSTLKGLGSEAIRGNFSGKSLTDRARETMGMERYQAMLDKVKQDAEFYAKTQRGYEYLNETRGDRSVTAAILGRGFYRKPNAQGIMEHVDNFTDFENEMRSLGTSAAGAAQDYAAARNLGGAQFAGRFAGTIAGTQRAGFGGFGEAFERLSRSGGTKEEIIETMRLALGSGSTPTAMGLVNSIAGFDPNGTLGQGGIRSLLSVFQNGFNPTGAVTDQNQLSRFGLGMQSLSNPLDGYGLGMRTISAIQAAPGASTYTQDALARLDNKQLLAAASGQGSQFFADMGLTPDAARKMIAGQFNSVFSRNVDQGTNEPYMKVLRKYQDAMRSGQDPFEFMSTLSGDEARQLGVAYSNLGGSGGFEAGVGAVNIGRGLAGKKALKFGKIPFGTIDDKEREMTEAENAQRKESAKQLKDAADAISTQFKNNENIGKTLVAFGTMSGVLNDVTLKLARLGGVSEAIVENAGKSIIAKTLKQAAEDVQKAKEKSGVVNEALTEGLIPTLVKKTAKLLK